MSGPTLASTREELAKLLAPARQEGREVGFVPTMGALHDGHASLMRTARERVDGPVVVSIFVNPMQFGPGEDLDRYPRTLDADLEVCAANSVDMVFAPSVDEVYPGGLPQVTVDPGPLATILEGKTRPAKLFGLVRPDVAVFGQKDYQQLALIRRMVADLCMGVEIVGAETVREDDGLALSSRNRFLDPQQRRQAVVLSKALRAAQARAEYGVPAARWAAMSVLKSEPGIELDYLAIRAADLGELPEDHPDQHGPDEAEGKTKGRVLVAARVGTTRLIDNLPITLGSTKPGSTNGKASTTTGGDPTKEREYS